MGGCGDAAAAVAAKRGAMNAPQYQQDSVDRALQALRMQALALAATANCRHTQQEMNDVTRYLERRRRSKRRRWR